MVGCIICLLLAVICTGYGILIKSLGAGTHFFIVWFFIGIAFLVLGLCARYHIWSLVPGQLKMVFGMAVLIALVTFLVVEAFIFSGFKQKEELNLDYIIVLGAQVHEYGPSVVLRYRLEKAISYLQDNEKTICIVSGGRGSNEPDSEAEIMTRFLEKNGIEKNRIIQENKSTSTVENLMFSKDIIKQSGGNLETARVGIITNDFHMFRALQIAKAKGFEYSYGLVARSQPLYLPNNVLREFFGEIKYLVLHKG